MSKIWGAGEGGRAVILILGMVYFFCAASLTVKDVKVCDGDFLKKALNNVLFCYKYFCRLAV